MAGGSRELVQSLALPINELDAQQTLLLGKEEAAGASNIGHPSSGSVRPGRSITDRSCLYSHGPPPGQRPDTRQAEGHLMRVGSACCLLVAGFIKVLTQLALALVLVGPNPQSLMVGPASRAPQLLPASLTCAG